MVIGVTGASGQLGGHVLDELLARGVKGADIVAISRSPLRGEGRAIAQG